jgi:OOP family OmpA-OmpF porin
LAAPLLLLALAGCNGTPANGLIPGSTYQLEQLNKTTATGSPFTQALTDGYRVFAQAERDEYDWHAQQVFAKKGLAAAEGTSVPPEELADWRVWDPAVTADESAARSQLMAMLASDAPNREEEYEGWETDEIAACRAAFFSTMEQINRPVAAAVKQPAPTPPPTPKAAPVGYVVFFDFDKSDLTPEAKQVLASAAQALKASHASAIRVTGYTDTVGTVAYNLKLSVRRGDRVEQELAKDGLTVKVEVIGKGKADLLEPTADGVREARNRRATIDVTAP